jgi:hypothetical protein
MFEKLEFLIKVDILEIGKTLEQLFILVYMLIF